MGIRKNALRIVTALLLIFAAASCQGMELRYAKGFTAEKRGDATLVRVINPWPGAQIAFSYLLLPHGKKVPEGYQGHQIVRVPVTRFISLSTTFLAFIEELDLLQSCVGFSDADRAHSRALQDMLARGEVVEVGRAGNLQMETVLDLSPEIIFSFASGTFRDAHPKLMEAGLKVGVVGEYMEGHPLGRAEWIKFLGLFTGREKEAEEAFSKVEERYLRLVAKTKDIANPPTLITGTPFSGRWYVAGGKSYLGQFFKDAGGAYVFGETSYNGSLPMDIELVYERGLEAEFWVDTGIWQSLQQAREADPRFKAFVSLQNGRLFNNNKRVNSRGGNDYWESGIMAPDVILADLIHILHPDLLPEHQLFYYTHLR